MLTPLIASLALCLQWGAPPELPDLGDADPGTAPSDPTQPTPPAEGGGEAPPTGDEGTPPAGDEGTPPPGGDGTPPVEDGGDANAQLEDNPEWDAPEEDGSSDDDRKDAAGGAGAGAAGGAAAGTAGAAGGGGGQAPAPSAPPPGPTGGRSSGGAGSGSGGGSPGGAGSGSGGGAAPAASAPSVQRAPAPAPSPAPSTSTSPGGSPGNSGVTSAPAAPTPSPSPAPAPAAELPAPEGPTPEGGTPEAEVPEEEPKRRQKLGGFKLFRIGLVSHVGYFNGTSQKNGLFDRDKSIQNSIDSGMIDPTGAGDLGEATFGGPAYGGTLDLEVFGVNAWLDVRKFFKPGGMWSLLVGYDHEIGFNHWLRLDLGAGFGVSGVFLGQELDRFYVDPDDPTKTDIARTGIEARAMADLQFRLFGPVFTGPGAIFGYHYLFTANDKEVVEEKGIHYGFTWNLRFDFAIRRKKKVK